jgi:putative sigma-54 modulation protein
MNIQITSRKFRAKDTLKDHIEKKIKSLQKYNSHILDVNVILSFTHLKDSIKTIEIILSVPGKVLTVSESSDDFRKSADRAVVKIERQLRKLKTKITSKPKVK